MLRILGWGKDDYNKEVERIKQKIKKQIIEKNELAGLYTYNTGGMEELDKLINRWWEVKDKIELTSPRQPQPQELTREEGRFLNDPENQSQTNMFIEFLTELDNDYILDEELRPYLTVNYSPAVDEPRLRFNLSPPTREDQVAFASSPSPATPPPGWQWWRQRAAVGGKRKKVKKREYNKYKSRKYKKTTKRKKCRRRTQRRKKPRKTKKRR